MPKKSVLDKLREVNKLGYEAGYHNGMTLKQMRKKFTQAFIAKELNVSERTVGRWLRGETKPSRGQLVRIGKFLNKYYL